MAMNTHLLWLVSAGVIAPFLMNLLPVLCLAIFVTVVSHLTLAAPQQRVAGHLRHVECSKWTWYLDMLPTVDGAVKANRHESHIGLTTPQNWVSVKPTSYYLENYKKLKLLFNVFKII